MRPIRLSTGLILGGVVWACSPSPEAGGDSGSGGVGAVGGQSASGGGGGGSGGTISSGGVEASSGGASLGGSPSGGAPEGTGGSVSPVECENSAPDISVEHLTPATIGELGTLFATDTADQTGPTDWDAMYGKSPEIIASPRGAELAVLFQDQASADSAYLVNLFVAAGTHRIESAYRIASLGRIMGLTRDDLGNYFVATGVDEDMKVDATYPPNGIHRPNIVRVVKFDHGGCVLMESDVDIARGLADDKSEIIVNPMVAGSSRLAHGGGQLSLLHSHNTEPDPELDGTRHQKAITTHLSADTGEVTRTSSLWVSHSFDQRLFFDGKGLVELHLGDAYPRAIAVGRYQGNDKGLSRELFHIKGALGDNNTFTRLGGIVPTPDPDFGYLVLFSTERTPTFEGTTLVRGTRDLALVRVRSDFAEVAESAVDEGAGTTQFAVKSSDMDVVNHLRWLTDLGENRHVERPRITALDGGESLALWEEWTVSGERSTFDGTFAMRLGTQGEVLAGPTKLPETHHIPRGDDAVTWSGRALFVGGSKAGLELNFVAPDLTYQHAVVP